ncbi:hypothetical protein BCV72DRAFT_208090, partial [Rhizopus microsporus var. microsporus]
SLLDQSVEDILSVREEHLENAANCRYAKEKPASLRESIDPIIMKLTYEEDSSGMCDLGPIYSSSFL